MARTRRLSETRTLHKRLFDDGALHFLARHDGEDAGLLTVEFTSPAPSVVSGVISDAARPVI